MRELKKDLFESCLEHDSTIDAICVTTNGNYTSSGVACMGGGCARECADRWPETAMRLGKCLKNFGTNVPFVIGAIDEYGQYIEPSLRLIKQKKFQALILSFPTIDNLMCGASIELIENSARELVVLANRFGLRNVWLARPGSGIGGLVWADVKRVIEPILDDRFTIVSFASEE